MRVALAEHGTVSASGEVLQAYVLGSVPFEEALALQRRLAYEIAGNRDRACLVLCEHPAGITVGRHGSRAHIRCEADELRARRWEVRWVNRGGGCVLHGPGQLAVYPVLALDQLGLGVRTYLERLHQVLADTLADFRINAAPSGRSGLWVGPRPIAAVGVAVRDWVTYYGAYLNINPDLEALRLVRWLGADTEPMTSLARERRGPVRPALVRELLMGHFSARFGFRRVSVFTDHPLLQKRAACDAVASRR